jgi:hypothetical protein
MKMFISFKTTKNKKIINLSLKKYYLYVKTISLNVFLFFFRNKLFTDNGLNSFSTALKNLKNLTSINLNFTEYEKMNKILKIKLIL